MNRLRWFRDVTIAVLLSGNLHPLPLGGQGGLATFREVHLGMPVRIVLPAGPGAATAAARAFEQIERLDGVLSDWRAASELRQVTTGPRLVWRSISPELADVLGEALDVARATNGAFDPTVGPLTLLWRSARDTGVPPSDSARTAAMTRVGWWLVDLDRRHHRVRFARDDIRLDLGAIAKGWILDQAASVLRDIGAPIFLIEAGGDLVVGEAPPSSDGWRIDVLTPHGDSVITVINQALSTSGPAAQTIRGPDGQRYSHVIDLRHARGSTSSRQVTVMGPEGAHTDALATAFTLIDRSRWDALARRFDVQVVATSVD
jgi:thiamine biosynthesis lipoprotein